MGNRDPSTRDGTRREARLEELDVEGLLEFARHLALNSDKLWTEVSHEVRQQLQACLFPNGVRYRHEEIWNPTKCPVFSDLETIQAPQARMVSPTGFEPVLPACKTMASCDVSASRSAVLPAAVRARLGDAAAGRARAGAGGAGTAGGRRRTGPAGRAPLAAHQGSAEQSDPQGDRGQHQRSEHGLRVAALAFRVPRRTGSGRRAG